ncbi:MAG: light-harvesting protein [Pseudomonadota bacterium]
MNNAKMWLVVSPNVGVPIFLGAVAVGSFAVHTAVLSNTSWVDDFLQGVPMGTGDGTAALSTETSDTAKASYVVPTHDGGKEITVILPDGTTAKAILQESDVLASASPLPE